MKGIRQQFRHVAQRQGRKHDVSNNGSALTYRIERPREGVGAAHLVVPKRPDQHEVMDVGVRREIFEQAQSGGVQPLEIVEKESERMLFPREHAENERKTM